jgi:hypothetical protein
MINILPSTAWREFRGVPSRHGLNPTTHLALIADLNGIEHKCYLKFIDLHHSPGLLCEGLGWLFAKAAGVNVPEFAAIVMVPIQQLSRSVNLPSWLKGQAEYPAWCVKVVDGKSVAEVHKWMFWLRRNKCLNAKETPTIAAFDIWTDNRDRNYGNVIRSNGGLYVAIDHESLLHDLTWKAIYNLEFDERSLLKEAESRFSPDRYHKFKCDVALAADNHEVAFNNASIDAKMFFFTVIPDASNHISIWNNIQNQLIKNSSAGWMSNRLGVIV